MCKLHTFNNIDCYPGVNFLIKKFTNLDDCINICNNHNISVFVLYKNIVYYRKQTIESCIKNMSYNKDSTTYILNNDNYFEKKFYYITNQSRVNIYCEGILSLKNYVFNKKNTYYKTKKCLKDYLENWTSKKWTYQHNENFLSFISSSDVNINEFNFNPYDLNYSQNCPTFVKSRSIENSLKSILLPLENLYIPSFYKKILNDDICFSKKKKTCVWRGANSGNFFDSNKSRASRRDLVLKYRFHKNFDVGLSYANYKTPKNYKLDLNIKDYVKSKLTIKEQLTYKYIISVEGNDFATNLSWIMLSNSVPLMAKPSVETWKMERNLIPYIHYVPLKNDFSDLETQIEWCNNNLDKCEEIAFMSKVYVLQFFHDNKEKDIINDIIKMYYNKTSNNIN